MLLILQNHQELLPKGASIGGHELQWVPYDSHPNY